MQYGEGEQTSEVEVSRGKECRFVAAVSKCVDEWWVIHRS
jgi:hypothetical protein